MAEASIPPPTDLKGPVVIITDSRGFGLQGIIDRIEKEEKTDYKIQTFVWKGRGITGAVRETSKQMVWLAPRLVIVFAGICDITTLNRTTRVLTMADPTPEEAIDRYEGQMDYIRHHLTIMLMERPFKVVFCELIGADLAVYNHMNHEHPQQKQLEEVILGINAKIVGFNVGNEMPTPWTAREVHHQKKSKTKVSRYQKLADDGLHLGEELKEKLARTLHMYIAKLSRGMVRKEPKE